MNEQIKNILKASGGFYHDDDGGEMTPCLVGQDIEKFAELIVRECIKVIDDKPIFGSQPIKEHFGVEE